MTYLAVGVLGLAALSWPLWQGEIPINWGEWPLNIAVMAFAVLMVRIYTAAVAAKDKAFTESLASIEAKHEAALTALGDTLKEVGDKTTAAAEKTTRAIQAHDKSTSRAVKIIEKSAQKKPTRRSK